jgi:hypothetical protein
MPSARRVVLPIAVLALFDVELTADCGANSTPPAIQ